MINKINPHYSMENPATIHDEEALTALQLAGRTTAKINELVENFNRLEEETDAHLADQDQQIPVKVENAVQSHIDDGDFDAAIDEYAGNLEARVNNLLGSVEEGSTTLDAELIDLRTDRYGNAHQFAGSAVRGQISDLARRHPKLAINNMLNVPYAVYQGWVYDPTTMKPVQATAYDTYEVTLPAGTYSSTQRIRFVGIPALGVSYDGDANCRPFTVSKQTRVLVSYFNSDSTHGSRDLYRIEDVSRWEVEAQGETRLDETVELPHPYKKIKDYFSANNLLNTAECFPGFMNLIDGNYNMASDDYVCYRLTLTPGSYVVGPRARYITNMTDGTELGDQSNPVASDFLVVDVEESPKLFYITMYTADANRYLLRHQDWTGDEPMYTNLTEADMEPADVVKLSANVQPAGNYLAGKRWTVLGDSFSVQSYVGDEGIDPSVYTYQYGPYKGRQIVYPYIIGLRNGMVVENNAVSGMSLCDFVQDNIDYGGQTARLPTNPDYITIRFGINDQNQNIEIGAETDDNVGTFCGCWNWLFDKLICTYPYAKIGVIITNGTNFDYANATRMMCQIWGIPYLDMVNDPTVPLMHRVDTDDRNWCVCNKAHQMRLKAFQVSETNTHPNVKAHEYESTFIENWIRSL